MVSRKTEIAVSRTEGKDMSIEEEREGKRFLIIRNAEEKMG